MHNSCKRARQGWKGGRGLLSMFDERKKKSPKNTLLTATASTFWESFDSVTLSCCPTSESSFIQSLEPSNFTQEINRIYKMK